MLEIINWQQISKQIEQVTAQPFSIEKISPISGGCINLAYQLQGRNKSYFIKINQPRLIDMFAAEFKGLEALPNTQKIKVPQVIHYGISNNNAFLILEMLSLAPRTKQSEQLLAQQLAALHRIKQPFFGWHQNNTIGSTKQQNDAMDNWITFWRNNRLGFQLALAEKNGYSKKLIHSGEKLCESLHEFINHHPHPSLLHGDLWSGNTRMTVQGEPVIYDPACYFGDREADIAMTELFGGFSANFYAAYHQSYPLDSGYSTRKTLYNLYHILNHLNLFGSSYQSQAQQMIDYLLSEVL